ncbi:hypothetical protein OCU04_001392 [Sclerotinia nivalis]|uniref:SWIM-type domain-containing protein n=1 Tax=Sclerotinia nivalis TaxID=352851 RepID=A0A9X0AY07_9HELO|nr:hypothetical protein OCU04_001392 [Sclerotinia nivalis]
MSTTHPPSLPPPRTFMTSLFNSLTASSSTTTSTSLNSTSNTNPNTSSVSQRTSYANAKETENSNPLKGIGAEKKALLMTLHVIFPPPLLLQALDLLDRGGVGRVVYWGEGDGVDHGDGDGSVEEGSRMYVSGGGDGGEEEDHGKGGRGEGMGVEEKSVHDAGERENLGDGMIHDERKEISGDSRRNVVAPQSHIHLPDPTSSKPPSSSPPSPPPSKPKNNKITIYQVRSSQPSKWNSNSAHSHSRSRSTSTSRPGIGTHIESSENPHTIHLNAWNCTCAAFTYSSFPTSSSSFSSPPTHPFPYASSISPIPIPNPSNSPPKEHPQQAEAKTWQYGSHQTQNPQNSPDSQIPICKHILACLLAERWGDVLGMYVRERVVGREEMAGLGV